MIPYKKIIYPLNIVLFNLCRLIPFRNKRLWIFGALEGKKYDDNSKAMFEYMLQAHSDEYRCVWLTNNANIVNQLRALGHEAYLNSTWKGKKIQLRAGVAFYTHGLMDFGWWPLVGGAKVVALWHGMGFKQIYNGKYHGMKLRLKKTLDHFFSWTYRNVSTVTSEYAAGWVTRMFTLNPKQIYITGQPRNDVLRSVNRDEVLSSIGINPKKKVAIFMPTYRQQTMGEDAMERIVTALYQSKELHDVLQEKNILFLVKLHPLTPPIELPDRDDFRILSYKDVTDNQQLMGACDMLVTDYSSCYVDYALVQRPIIFYMPDEQDFYEKSETLDEGFTEIAHSCRAATANELARLITNPSMAAVEAINDLFEDKSIRGTCYAENVFRVVAGESI